MAIYFHEEEVIFHLQEKRKIKKWLSGAILHEKKSPGTINIVFTSDEKLREVNKQFLSKDYYTDILTFDYCEEGNIAGDLFISIERVKENAKKYEVAEHYEMLRVLIHGLLHLLGYEDSSDDQIGIMRSKENYYIKEYKKAQ